MLDAATEEHTPEEVARMHRQAHGVIGGDDLPLPPAPALGSVPPRPAVPLPGLPPLTGGDDGATVPVPLLEMEALTKEGTPPPLPPSPASAAAEVWLEDAVTRPSMLSDIAASMAGPTRDGIAIAGAPAFAAFEPSAHERRTARIVLILTSATTFILGMILGALLFRP